MNTELFWAKVDSSDPDRCWPWMATRTKHGYGRWTACQPRRAWIASRLAWTLTFGDIPEGMHVLHSCDNPPCCRPDHLFLGTPLDNAQDKIAKGRLRVGWSPGAKNGRSKLTEAQVLAIRAEYSGRGSGVRLARKYGVGEMAISDIIRRRNWRHI